MYDPKSGKSEKANKEEDHHRLAKKGYTHVDPSKIEDEFEKQVQKLKPRPVDPNDPSAWFWKYIEQRNKEYIEWETKGKWEQ